MADLAKQLNEDAKLWRIVGLLHDLDYDAVKGGYAEHGVVLQRN
jgi:predicted hydrolase (HD superfamily)